MDAETFTKRTLELKEKNGDKGLGDLDHLGLTVREWDEVLDNMGHAVSHSFLTGQPVASSIIFKVVMEIATALRDDCFSIPCIFVRDKKSMSPEERERGLSERGGETRHVCLFVRDWNMIGSILMDFGRSQPIVSRIARFLGEKRIYEPRMMAVIHERT